MRITSRLIRVENSVGIGRRCLSCRVHYIRFGDEIKRTAPGDLFVTSCAICKQTLKLIHSGYTERERSVLVAVNSDPHLNADEVKWLSSYAWMQHLPRFQEIKEIGVVEEKRLRELVNSNNLTLRQSARKQVAVLDEYAALKQIQEESAEKLKQCSPSSEEKIEPAYAPLLEALDGVRKRWSEIKDRDLFSYLVMAEMEVFMWGEKSAETLTLIQDRKRQLAEEEEQRTREAEERERKYQEEKRLREEESNRRNEEYLARNRSSRPAATDYPRAERAGNSSQSVFSSWVQKR